MVSCNTCGTKDHGECGGAMNPNDPDPGPYDYGYNDGVLAERARVVPILKSLILYQEAFGHQVTQAELAARKYLKQIENSGNDPTVAVSK